MYKVTDKSLSKEFQVRFSNNDKTTGFINGKSFALDILKENPSTYHVLWNNKSYNTEIDKFDTETKTISIKINGRKHELVLKDRFDDLLKEMGIDTNFIKKVKDIKAPMPGLVFNILIHEGDAIKQGDALLILEAMKMENIIKSPVNGIIKKIHITKSNAVEKGQLLISFE